jgi:phosphomannomutase
MSFSSSIFKAYDIRGLVETELSNELAYRIGHAFVCLLRQKNIDLKHKYIIVGRDMRPSSVEFAQAVIRGIQEEGIDVIDIGLSSTPLFNFACAHYKNHAGGIMVTASHNPAEYNGFKLTLGDGLPIGKNTGMNTICELVQSAVFHKNEYQGKVVLQSVLEEYFKAIFALINPQGIRPLKLVIDAGNGMAKVTFPKLLEQLPVTVEYLYLEPDGTFPNHESNPLKTETLKDLQQKVVDTKADFGFALDGDCDRIGLVDEKGQVIAASYVGALLGLEVLKKHPQASMFYDLRSSMIVKEVWEEAGAVTEMCMVGHALIKKYMREKNAVFASELSQHLYYKDIYNLESSDLSLLYVLQLLSREQKSLSEIVKPLQKYFHSGEINFEVKDKAGVLKKIEEKYIPFAQEISHLDGVWMKFEWGWFSVRTSNTEPVLRLNLEASVLEKMQSMIQELEQVIKG